MKRMLTFIGALLIFLIGAFIKTNQNQTLSTTKKIPTVGILQPLTHPALDEIHQGFVAGLKSEGFIDGQTVKLDFQNAQGDQSNLKTMSTKFVDEKVDLMAAIATPAAQACANTAKGQTPVLLAGITDPVGAKLIKTDQHPGGNVTGTSGDAPLDKQLQLLQEVVPQAKKIGIIYSSSDHGGEYNAKNFGKLVTQAGLTPKFYTISNTNDMQQVAQQMVGDVDAVYAPQDNNVATAMKTLVSAANAAKKPVFASADTMVKDGALAAYAITQFDLGKVAGQMAGQVLKGRKTANYPLAYVTKGHNVINEKTARTLGINLPKSVVHQAQTKGELIK